MIPVPPRGLGRDAVPKYGASRTLTEPLSWHGSSVLFDDLADAVAGVKGRHHET